MNDQDRIEKVVELAAPVSEVWRALTDYVRFGEWFGVQLDGPFKVGATTTGRITQTGHEDVEWVSVTEEMTPERRFVFSWPPGAVDRETEFAADAKVTVAFALEPTDRGTRLTITESGFRHFPERNRLDILRSNLAGWDVQAKNIEDYVAP